MTSSLRTSRMPVSLLTTVMFIEEERNARAFFNTCLSRTGKFQVVTAASPDEAFELLETLGEGSLDILVIDLLSQAFDARVFLQRCAERPEIVETELLVYSDEVTPDDLFLLREFGVRHVMRKRISGHEVEDAIGQVLQDRLRCRGRRGHAKKLEKALLQRDISTMKALASNDKMMTELKDDPWHLHLVGEMEIALGEPKKAIDFLSEKLRVNALAGEPETFRSLNTLGKALCLSGSYSEALAVYAGLTGKSPQNLRYLVGMGESHLGLQNTAAAKEAFGAVLARDPSNEAAQAGLGKAHLVEGDVPAAVKLFVGLSASAHAYPLASFMNNMGVSMLKQGRFSEAMSLLGQAISLFPAYRQPLLFNRGMALLRQGNSTEAFADFTLLLSTGDEDFIARKSILRELREQGEQAVREKYGKSVPGPGHEEEIA